MREKWTEENTHARWENSFGSYGDKEVTMTFIVAMEENRGGYGHFEVYSDCESFYAEGGIWVNEDKEVVDFDGVFDLMPQIKNKLREWGYTITWGDD